MATLTIYKYKDEYTFKDYNFLYEPLLFDNFKDEEAVVEIINIETQSKEIIKTVWKNTNCNVLIPVIKDNNLKRGIENIYLNRILSEALAGNDCYISAVLSNISFFKERINCNFIEYITKPTSFYIYSNNNIKIITDDFFGKIKLFAYSPYTKKVVDVVLTKFSRLPKDRILYIKGTKVRDMISTEEMGFLQTFSAQKFDLYALLVEGDYKIIKL